METFESDRLSYPLNFLAQPYAPLYIYTRCILTREGVIYKNSDTARLGVRAGGSLLLKNSDDSRVRDGLSFYQYIAILHLDTLTLVAVF